jgi:hypothetical protein
MWHIMYIVPCVQIAKVAKFYISEYSTGLGEALYNGGKAVVEGAGNFAEETFEELGIISDDDTDDGGVAEVVVEGVSDVVQGAAGFVGGVFEEGAEAIGLIPNNDDGGFVETVVDGVASGVGAVVDGVGGALGAVGGALGDAWNSIWG